MHTFDNDYNYLGKVTVMGERDIRYGGMEYSSRFNTFCVTDVAKGRCAVHLMPTIILNSTPATNYRAFPLFVGAGVQGNSND